jgi:hypothetical protein
MSTRPSGCSSKGSREYGGAALGSGIGVVAGSAVWAELVGMGIDGRNLVTANMLQKPSTHEPLRAVFPTAPCQVLYAASGQAENALEDFARMFTE